MITITSIIGSIVSSEALKLTGKYIPIEQWYWYNAIKYIPDEIDTTCLNQRYQDNVNTYGAEVQLSLSAMNILLPGVGAIGWEVLKWIAWLGWCSKYDENQSSSGVITIIDYDKLEISNLSRQFLFSEADNKMFKVDVAKKKIVKINSKLNIKSLDRKLDINVYK